MPTVGPPRMDRYQKLQVLAHGGMAEVWRAWDVLLGRDVAIKVLDESCASRRPLVRTLQREARTAAALGGHPNVVTTYDVGECEGRPFIVMQYARGGSVADRIRQGAVSLDRALRWLAQAASALDHAHDAGIVHGDVKPGNLLLDDRGDVLVSDFGVAAAAGSRCSDHDQLLATPGYVAPEVVRWNRASPAGDRYALAVVAFELLTGRRPFARPTAAAEVHAHLHEPPPSAVDLQPGLPPAVDALLRRALAKTAQARPARACAFVAELHALLERDLPPDLCTLDLPEQRGCCSQPATRPVAHLPAAATRRRRVSRARRMGPARLRAVGLFGAALGLLGVSVILGAHSVQADPEVELQPPGATAVASRPAGS